MACGPVSVYRIGEALNLSRAAMVGQTVVIVSTIQSFRVEDTTGRQVYAQAGVFDEHLQNVPADRIADLARGTMDAGSHRATWSGTTASGAKAGAGVYFVRGRVGDQSYSRSVLVVR